MMNKAPISRLILKEYYCTQKIFKMVFLNHLIMFAATFLALGSFQYGNLRLLEETDRNLVYSFIVFYIRLVPIMAFGSMGGMVGEYSVKEERGSIRRFFMTTPISGYRIVAAKLSYCLLLQAAGCVLMLIYCLFLQGVFHIAVHPGIIGLFLMGHAVFSLLQFSLWGLGLVTKSMDMAGILLMVIDFVIGGIAYVIYNAIAPGKIGMDISQLADQTINGNALALIDNLERKGMGLIPYAILAIVIVYVLAFLCIGKLYERREK